MIKVIFTPVTLWDLEISPDSADLLPGMAVHICNPSAQETETGTYKYEASLDYILSSWPA